MVFPGSMMKDDGPKAENGFTPLHWTVSVNVALWVAQSTMYNPCHMPSPNPGRTLNNIQFGPPPPPLSFTHPYTMPTNSTIENINTPKNAQLTSILSHAVKAYGPGLIFCSGCTPHDSALTIVEGGIKEHTEQVIHNLTNVLESAGSSWEKVVKVNVYLTDMNEFGAMNEVYERMLPSPKPARTCVQVVKLPGGADVEMECIAAI